MLPSDGPFAGGRDVDQKKPFIVFLPKVFEIVLDLILSVTGVRLVLNGQAVGLSISAADVNGDVNTPVWRDPSARRQLKSGSGRGRASVEWFSIPPNSATSGGIASPDHGVPWD